MTYSKIIEG